MIGWLIKRYLKGMKLGDAPTPNQQIEALQQQIAALKAMQVANPLVSLHDQLAALQNPAPSSAAAIQQLALGAPLSPVIAPPALAEPEVSPAPEVAAVSLPEAPAEATPQSADPIPKLDPDIVMTDTTSQTPAPAALPAAPSTGSTLPDVKMLAPILKIALATLSIEQMVEIGLHVKMGAPGFQQFLESDIAKVKFRELYATYCDFLAGKVK